MIKTKLLISLLLLSIIGGCGFHMPYKNKSINVNIIDQTRSIIASKISQNIDPDITPLMTVKILSETKRQDIGSYDSNGKESGYILNYSVKIQVYDKDNNLSLEKIFSSQKFLRKMESSQANTIQINDTYEKLINSVVKKLLRQLNRLNES